MRPMLRGTCGLLLVLAIALPAPGGAQETRTVSGIVVDAERETPISGALVTIRGTGLSIVTDEEGRFALSAVPLGSLDLVLSHVAYGEHAEPLNVVTSGSLDFRIRVSSRAIELAPLGVDVASSETQARRASGTATNVIDRATIAAFPTGGQGLLPILESRIPSLRVQGDCVEYRFFQYGVTQDPNNAELVTSLPCRDVVVYVDGMPDRQGSALLERLSPNDVERIEVLSAAEAGLQYWAGGRGVILVETRRGVVTETPDRIHINGFGWSDPEPYPWVRVLGASALGNAALAGLASSVAFDCGDDEIRVRPPLRCNGVAGVGGAFLTSMLGRIVTQKVGRTPYTEGRTYPALLMSVATASVGYMLYLHGENNDSGSHRTAGQVVLAVGVPVALTLSDRVFRMVR